MYQILPGNPGLSFALVPPPEFFSAVDEMHWRSSTVRSCDTYHISPGAVGLSGVQIPIPESLSTIDPLCPDLQPSDQAARNQFRWVVQRLFHVHINFPGTNISVDLCYLQSSAVGSCGAHSIPLGSLVLSVEQLRSAELISAVDEICL